MPIKAVFMLMIAALLLSIAPPIHAREALALPSEAELTNPKWAREGYANLADPFLKRTRYLLALDVDWAHGKINGQVRVLYVNNTSDVLNEAAFRLFPNHPIPAAYGDVYTGSKPRLIVQSVQIKGTEAAFATPDKYRTLLTITLPNALQIGEQTEIMINYTVNLSAPTDSLDVREAFPMAAIYEGGRWRSDVLTKSLDYVFSETALFAVTLRTVRDVSLYCTGSITQTAIDGNDVTYSITTGPVRDFVFLLTKGWGFLVEKNAPVQIDVRYRGSEALAQEMATIAAESMGFFDKVIGAYPYAHLTFLVLSYPTGGEEYPTLLFNDNARDTSYRRFITAHEVAHQWFYGIAGNDIARHAWLDESLAQIAMYLFYRDHYGTVVAEKEWASILTWSTRLKGAPRPIDTAVEAFTDFSDYMTHTYGLGAVFMRELAEKIGYEKFTAGLAAYYKAAYFQVGTPIQFFDAMQAQTTINLKPLFCQRMGYPCTS